MALLIRPLVAADEPFLWTALYHAIHVPPGGAAPAPDVVRHPALARYVEGWARRPGDGGLAAVDAGAPVGAAWLRLWTAEAPGFGFVDEATPELSMALLPGHRGLGTGTRLLHGLLGSVRGRHPAVSLSVSLSNPALRLYEREGFVPVGGAAGGSVTMVKALGP